MHRDREGHDEREPRNHGEKGATAAGGLRVIDVFAVRNGDVWNDLGITTIVVLLF
jgi:hypothetical protein